MDQLLLARADWLQLHDRWEDASAYTAYDWIAPWFRWYAPGQRSWILRAREGHDTVGFAPLYGWRGTLGGLPVRRIDFLGHNFGVGSFVAPGDDPRVIRGFLDHLRAAQSDWDVLALKGIARGSAAHRALATWLGEHDYTFEVEPFTVPTIDLRGGWAKYLATKGKNLQSQLARARKKAAAAGAVEFTRVRPREGAEVERLMARIVAISLRSRKADFFGAIGSNTHVEAFYRDVARGFRRDGRLDLALLSLGGVDVAYVLGLVQGRRYYHIDTAFDEAYRDTSSGTLVNLQVIRELFDDPELSLYVNEGEDAYKARWVTGGLERVSIYVFGRSLTARAAHRAKFVVQPLAAQVGERLETRARSLRARWEARRGAATASQPGAAADAPPGKSAEGASAKPKR